MTIRRWISIGMGAAAFGICASALAGTKCKQESKGLNARAKVTCEQALKAARTRVPNGSVKSAELVEENGKLVYSFDIKVAKKSGIEEVQVDALTGEVVSVEHEDAKAEAAERKKEAK